MASFAGSSTCSRNSQLLWTSYTDLMKPPVIGTTSFRAVRRKARLPEPLPAGVAAMYGKAAEQRHVHVAPNRVISPDVGPRLGGASLPTSAPPGEPASGQIREVLRRP
jgi:hypothetical protein